MSRAEPRTERDAHAALWHRHGHHLPMSDADRAVLDDDARFLRAIGWRLVVVAVCFVLGAVGGCVALHWQRLNAAEPADMQRVQAQPAPIECAKPARRVRT